MRRVPPHLGALTLVALVYQLLLQWSFASLAEFDAYYHVGLAQLYGERGLVRAFPWMELSILKDRFNDPQLLLHLLMLPLVKAGVAPIVAGKLVAVVSAVGLFVAFYWFLWRRSVKHAPLFALLLLVASPYLIARLTFIKSTPLFLALLFVYLDAVIERRHRRAFALAWLAVYTYQGFPLLLVVALLHLGACAIVGEALEPRTAGATVAGFAAGLVLNPFFPNDLHFFNFEIVEQILMRPKEVVLGAEWGAIESSRLLESTFLPLALVFVAETVGQRTRAGTDAAQLTLRALALFMLMGAMMSSRILDYFVPLALAAAAVVLSRALEGFSRERALLVGLVGFLCVPAAAVNLKGGVRLAKAIAATIRPDEYQKVAEHLTANTQDGELVIAQWDDFPALFFFDRQNHYPFGLNPMYGHGFDAQLFNAHQLLYEGRIRDPESLLKGLKARYLVIARASAYPGRRALVESLRKNEAFALALQVGETWLFELK